MNSVQMICPGLYVFPFAADICFGSLRILVGQNLWLVPDIGHCLCILQLPLLSSENYNGGTPRCSHQQMRDVICCKGCRCIGKVFHRERANHDNQCSHLKADQMWKDAFKALIDQSPHAYHVILPYQLLSLVSQSIAQGHMAYA